MKSTLLITIIAAIVSTVLVYCLSAQNKFASNGDKSKGYFAFNWNSVSTSTDIMQYWRSDGGRIKAIKNIVWLDYVFMAVYSSYFCFMLYRQSLHQQKPGLVHWLQAGIAGILLCLITDALQDYRIYSYITSNTTVNEMRGYTYFKWSCFLFGIIPLLISLFLKINALCY